VLCRLQLMPVIPAQVPVVATSVAPEPPANPSSRTVPNYPLSHKPAGRPEELPGQAACRPGVVPDRPGARLGRAHE
jgi:hypothetical protein